MGFRIGLSAQLEIIVFNQLYLRTVSPVVYWEESIFCPHFFSMLNAKGENVVKWILVSLHANWLFSGKEISLLQELRNVPHFHADSGHRWAKNHIKIYIPMIIYTNTTGFLRNKNWNHDITLLFLLFFLTRVSVFFHSWTI